jgi:hypothetical protein
LLLWLNDSWLLLRLHISWLLLHWLNIVPRLLLWLYVPWLLLQWLNIIPRLVIVIVPYWGRGVPYLGVLIPECRLIANTLVSCLLWTPNTMRCLNHIVGLRLTNTIMIHIRTINADSVIANMAATWPV